MDIQSDSRLLTLARLSKPIYLFDTDAARILWANQAALRFWSAESIQDLSERDLSAGISDSVKQRLQRITRVCYEKQRAVAGRWTLYPMGLARTADLSLSPFPFAGREDILLVEVVQERSDLADEDVLRTSALMHTNTMISAYGEDLELIYANPAALDFIHDRFKALDGMLCDPSDMHRIDNALAASGCGELELEVNAIDGTCWHHVHLQHASNPSNGRPMLVISANDVTERRLAQQAAYRLAFSDTLTGLPNRAALDLYLDELMSVEASEGGVKFGLMFLDLDRFKVINDSLGHAAGDQLLIHVAQRLKQAVGAFGTVYRLGGDEFVIIINQRTGNQTLKKVAESVLFANTEPVHIAEHELRVLPSIGICRYPEDGSDVKQLMENADAAMYIAKADKTGYCFYDQKMSVSISESVKDRMSLENDLGHAVENGEFELYFQPKISCRNFAVSGVEALVRWHHPTRGLVPPDRFIGIAEETGQIIDLGNWVLSAAMQQQQAWEADGIQVPVSLNISARQFSDNDLLANVSDALRSTACNPLMIELEITESMLIGEPDGVQATLQQLGSMGIRLALDDFGTGYSNLAHLQKYPLDTLKIDKAFLADKRRSMLMGTILQMGRVLGLNVVAEGVETASQADWLIARGCDQMQGYYFSKPLPLQDTTLFLLENGVTRIDPDVQESRHNRAA